MPEKPQNWLKLICITVSWFFIWLFQIITIIYRLTFTRDFWTFLDSKLFSQNLLEISLGFTNILFAICYHLFICYSFICFVCLFGIYFLFCFYLLQCRETQVGREHKQPVSARAEKVPFKQRFSSSPQTSNKSKFITFSYPKVKNSAAL